MSEKPATPETPAQAAPAAPEAATPPPGTIVLQEPIPRPGGTDVARIALRKPRAGEMRGLKVGDLINGDVSAVLTLVPRIAQPFITDAEAAQLSTEDLAEIAGTVTGFFLTPQQKAMIAQLNGG